MTIKELRKAIRNVPDEVEVVFQANEPGEEDEGTANATHTFALGTVFGAFLRERGVVCRGMEFVIDGAVTERE